jgi:FAD dependent oxidoreductase TIGR03364
MTAMLHQVWDVVVIGAGVLGSFHAYFACRRGLRTLLIDRAEQPRQASVRNFGMVIPSGMAPGEWHRRARESAGVYRQLAEQLGFPCSAAGTLYLATTPAETQVLQEFATLGPPQGYACRLLDARQVLDVNPAVDPAACLAGLHFAEDLRFEPGRFFQAFLPWLQRELGCTYLARTVAVRVTVEGGLCRVETAEGQTHQARHVFVCNGSDLQTLFPQRFASSGLLHCKLQMLRLEAPGDVLLPTCLASGLSLRRYASFRLCPSWPQLEMETVNRALLERGIHVLLAQDADNSVVLGDSHEYTAGDLSDTLDAHTEELILAEAQRLVRLPSWRVAERWHGVYTLHPQRDSYHETVAERIHLLTGIGGKGMTVGPALARETIEQIFRDS